MSLPSAGGTTGDQSLNDRLALLRSAAESVEALAAEYHATLQPLRSALQGVADSPIEPHDQWADAVSLLGTRLSEWGMGDVPSSLVSIPRWNNAFDSGQPGRAFAGQAFCAALAGVIANGTLPAEFFATLGTYKFITHDMVAREICTTLSHLMHVLTERTAPQFAARFALIVSDAEICGETLRLRLAQCCMPLSRWAEAAISDWSESRTPWPMYEAVEIRPPATAGGIAHALERTGGAQSDAETHEGAETSLEPLAQLLVAAANADLIGREAKVVRIIAEKGGKVLRADAATLCDGDAMSAFKRAKPKMKKQGWNLRQRDNHLCAELSVKVRK